ncbi:Imm1 family immunity protein [Allokutzneria sp. A3M-2-11 16]|uniref:Imm1 family immunity protein n=1 Tax=Allokutzneria sp. A3M-2-11 16 TaxID=2962043 RepID=UPI0020B7AC3C|nr:Imm1 family immunity protein [Allokutzneria sp. A3M-2-11 16]MCP3802567.1 Imm1 family immunity protein [Allokutzneria sp. A3M-2-11 16]
MSSGAELILSAIIDNRFVYARTGAEKAEVIDRVVDDAHPRWASLLYLWDRPCRSMRAHDVEENEFPRHQMRVHTSPEEGWGAINFSDEEAAWDTHNPAVPDEAPPMYFDPGHGTEFDRSATIRLDLVRAAVREFTVTGARPTCVAWQAARLI